MPTRLRLALAGAVLLVLTACGQGTTSGSAPTTSGSAPTSASVPGAASHTALTATTLEGDDFEFASISGRPTVLWFWAPWCTICRAEAPEVAKVAADLDGSVTFLGVPGRGERPDMKRFVADAGVSNFAHVVDEDGAIWNEFGVFSQPAFALIDSAGNVEMVNGSLTGEQLESAARALAG